MRDSLTAILVLTSLALACEGGHPRPVDDAGLAWPIEGVPPRAYREVTIPPDVPDGGCEELLTVHLDVDGDGFGNPHQSWVVCELTEGYSLNADDCDDTNPRVNPDAPEVCDDGQDNDCDRAVDEGCTPADGDGDGDSDGDLDDLPDEDADLDDEPPDGDVEDVAVECWADPDCDDGAGCSDDICVDGTCLFVLVDWDGDGELAPDCGGGDCDDLDPGVNPREPEVCGDGIDQNCDGRDETCACPDRDGDGFESASCGGLDCDDGDPLTYPDAPEICEDGVDQDCSGGDVACLSPCADLDCDDGRACTVDFCDMGVCGHVEVGCLPPCHVVGGYHFCRLAANWPDAMRACRARGLELASVTSRVEQDDLAALALALPPGVYSSDWWIGGTDAGHVEPDGFWAWSSEEPWGFAAWGPLEPNNWGGAEDCLEIDISYSFGWNDLLCETVQPYICEG